jgi:hypothetical protein
MLKFFITSFLILTFAVPALAKPIDVYSVSCNELWIAVKDTLGNQNDYVVIAENEGGHMALFILVGALNHYNDKVVLIPKDGGCVANASVPEDGPGNGDWRQFQNRLARSLKKLQAAKPKPVATETGQP